jgi:hypothetical protein
MEFDLRDQFPKRNVLAEIDRITLRHVDRRIMTASALVEKVANGDPKSPEEHHCGTGEPVVTSNRWHVLRMGNLYGRIRDKRCGAAIKSKARPSQPEIIIFGIGRRVIFR